MNDLKERLIKVGMQILSASRNEIYMSMRFFDLALSALGYEMSLKTKSIGTDGYTIHFNPAWLVDTYKEWPQDVNRAFVHMLMHCIFRHADMRNERDERLWNLSCDIAAESLVDHFDAACVRRVVSDEREAWYYRISTESKVLNAQSVYRYFMKHTLHPRELMKAEQIFQVDDHSFWNENKKEQKDQNDQQGFSNERQKKWKEIAEKTKTNMETFSRKAGDKAGDMVLQMAIDLHETYDYRKFLKKFTVMNEEMQLDMDNFDYIFYMYGLNHYGNVPLIEPLEYRENEKIRDFVIIVDTSMSCTDEILQNFFNETFRILHSMDSFYKNMNLHIIQCDQKVQSDIKIENEQQLLEFMRHLTIRGRGGTDFRAGISYVEKLVAEEEFRNLKGVLYFTDGYGEFPKKKPSFETAFVFVKEDYTDVKVPTWAMKVILEPDEILTWSEANEH